MHCRGFIDKVSISKHFAYQRDVCAYSTSQERTDSIHMHIFVNRNMTFSFSQNVYRCIE